jgi:hypothetical protein
MRNVANDARNISPYKIDPAGGEKDRYLAEADTPFR